MNGYHDDLDYDLRPRYAPAIWSVARGCVTFVIAAVVLSLVLTAIVFI